MAPRSHVCCVPFPGAGHAVNMFNIAVTLANPNMPVHTFVLSRREAEKWLAATGQSKNDYVTIEVLADGKWEDWHADQAMDYFRLLQSPEFSTAVEAAVLAVEEAFPEDVCAALVFNPTMGSLGSVASRRGLRPYLLVPTPYYMIRVGSCHSEGVPLTTKHLLNGIGGSETPVEVEVGDAMDLTTPMWYQVIKPLFENSAGLIYSNTNIGLEGGEFQQPHLPTRNDALKPVFMVGPILPQWYENALEDPTAKDEYLAKAAEKDPCIQFLDAHQPKSVVYIALGSHVELEQWQAEAIIKNLRKHNVRWILLYRNDTQSMRQALGGDDIHDGVVTPWAPQLEIMMHSAIKCVLSHGGFGTMVEGVYAGQCFITSPCASDQFIDSKVMLNLGISLGTLAVNKHVSVAQMPKMVPIWSDDSGKHVEKLFDHVFGTSDGDRALQTAREASLALRRRMKEAKMQDGVTRLEDLRKDITSVS
ncbi:uncharacterized protein HMPREF1541_03515 [Cyphellophora europaea CBS 101466]|uniref:UDP-glycosyltransferases domain-containing protein n=1 Tax=Cyphellophora europaea (strain CBS 101466) TaxID=1220924 RepID=W2S0U9_CYPE1|nr:uncharacterized protein HMPREF1541_03515 [Cyphellophora europaea CBS 101466]ETN41579.1 hypothetical protein HMPREF1541_03515 [Cyphellophora europaea CBS 101466]